MINSLRPSLADSPAVLQQKWHWDHLSMLPDNAHKCEICQTQYVNNHNCTDWGHVQANPTETLLGDAGRGGFSSVSLQRLSSDTEWEKWTGWNRIRVSTEQLLCLTGLCTVKYLVWAACLQEMQLTIGRSNRGYWPENAKTQSQIKSPNA